MPSQIDVIEFLNAAGEKVKVYAAPFKIKEGSNITLSASGNTLTITGASGGTTNHAALSHLDFASAGHTGFEATANKGIASGYAPLDSDSLVPLANLPDRGRAKLTSNTTFYVRADGDDSNDGSANDAAHAWATPAHAIEYLSTLDCNGFTVTISVGDGTYDFEGLYLFDYDLMNCWRLYINGNFDHPENVILGDVEDNYALFVNLSDTEVFFQGFTISNSAGYGIGVRNSATPLVLYAIHFGDVQDAHIRAFENGKVILGGGSWHIKGSAAEHFLAEDNGSIAILTTSFVAYLDDTYDFSTAFAHANYNGKIVLNDLLTWSGSATGKHFISENNSLINTNGQGLDWFPGDEDGEVLDTSAYDDNFSNVFVPSTRTVNGKALSSDITLTTADVADSSDKRYCTDAQKVVIGNTSGTNSGNETTTTIGSLINGATEKTTPIDADMLGLMDSGASNILKKLSWVNIKAALKTYFDTLYAAITSSGRTKLAAAKTYYVRTDGNDSNDGSANDAAHAFLTIQKAVNVYQSLDCNGYDVTISVADGTYTGGAVITGRLGTGDLYLVGNVSTPSNVVVSTSSHCFRISGHPSGSQVYLRGFKSISATGVAIYVDNGSYVKVGSMNFGACSIHMYAANSGIINTDGTNYTISGNANYHLYASTCGSIYFTTAITVTLTGTPAFTYFALNAFSKITHQNVTFSGSATGTRYVAYQNGVIDTNGGGANYFPGNSAGSVSSGGQYL